MQRDTDQDWNNIANQHPYFGVLSNERYLTPTEEDLVDFYLTGDGDIASLLRTIRQYFGEFSPKSGLDFGCGVGRLLVPMAKVCGQAVGVEIAARMKTIAEEYASKMQVGVSVVPAIPEGQRYDWVNTLIVLQHIPPDRGYEIVRKLWDAVAPGGILSMHLTIYKDARHQGELGRDLRTFAYDGNRVLNYTQGQDGTPSMSMFDYDLSRVFACVALPDGADVVMRKTDHGGCHGFIVFARKQGT